MKTVTGKTWTGYHEFVLNMMVNRETRVSTDRRDGPLIDRIRRCLKYLKRRANRKD